MYAEKARYALYVSSGTYLRPERALAEPDGSYVIYMADNVDSSPTIMISDAELGDIKKEAGRVVPETVREEEKLDEDAIDPKLEGYLKYAALQLL